MPLHYPTPSLYKTDLLFLFYKKLDIYSVAMKLTGHKTEAVYRRYAIVSEADLSEGVKKLAALNGAKALFLFFRFTIYQSRFTEFPAERVNRKW